MEDTRKQALLSMVKSEPRSIQDIADMTGVHYVTASRWMTELKGAGLIVKMPFPRGKETLYTTVNEALSEHLEKTGLVVQAGGQIKTLAEMATIPPPGEMGYSPYLYVKSSLAYLYRRSRNLAVGEGYQGIWTALDIKDQVRAVRNQLVEEVKVLEQLLLTDELWKDDDSVWQKMGAHPDMPNLDNYASLVDIRFKSERTVG